MMRTGNSPGREPGAPEAERALPMVRELATFAQPITWRAVVQFFGTALPFLAMSFAQRDLKNEP